MTNIVVIIYLGIALIMVIAAIILGRRRPSSHLDHDTTRASDSVDCGSNDTQQDHHHGHADPSASSDSSPKDSGF